MQRTPYSIFPQYPVSPGSPGGPEFPRNPFDPFDPVGPVGPWGGEFNTKSNNTFDKLPPTFIVGFPLQSTCILFAIKLIL